jgi:hypothetical protein
MHLILVFNFVIVKYYCEFVRTHFTRFFFLVTKLKQKKKERKKKDNQALRKQVPIASVLILSMRS